MMNRLTSSSQGNIWLRLYDIMVRFSIGGWLLGQLRMKLERVYVADERAMRLRTVRHLLWIVLAYVLSWLVVVLFTNEGFLVVFLIAGSVYLFHAFHELLLERLEQTSLTQLIHALGEVRFHYHRYRMVAEAIAESAERAHPLARGHLLQVWHALHALRPEEALTEYYELAPNRFLQAFAGISYMVMEYGDEQRQQGSTYLKAIAALIAELELEHVRRQRLHYLLRSLQLIACAPLLVMEPLKRWAGDSFPPMASFYESDAGLLCQLAVFVVMVICFVAVRALRRLEMRPLGPGLWASLCRWLLRTKWCSACLRGWTPKPNSNKYAALMARFQMAGTGEFVESFYLRRIAMAVTILLSSLWIGLRYFGFHWWHVVVYLLLALGGYLFPVISLTCMRWTRSLSMRLEVEQFEVMIGLLCASKRVNVELLLEWMERFAVTFKRPIQRCLLNFSGDGGAALAAWKRGVTYEPLVKLLAQLQEAAERIDVTSAFDDLLTDREFVAEQRKLRYEKLIRRKAALGKAIGFLPLYTMMFVYLLVPMMYVSANSMQDYQQLI